MKQSTMAEKNHSISTHQNNVAQDIFNFHSWTITTKKSHILHSQCLCPAECALCKYRESLPGLPSLPDMVFDRNILRLKHRDGPELEFNPLDALKTVDNTKNPLRVAVADGWREANADCVYSKNFSKPYDWTFTTDYQGSLNRPEYFSVSETEERINIDRLRIEDEILFYDNVDLFEDELADHGVAQLNIKIRVMKDCFFLLMRYFLRVDQVLTRINDTRIFHAIGSNYLIREYTNREAELRDLALPTSVLTDPVKLAKRIPLTSQCHEKITFITQNPT